MKTTILSMNVGRVKVMKWDGKEVRSSMERTPILGPLVVSETNVEGDSFFNPNIHGTPDNVLYAFGMTSALKYMEALGRDSYPPGALGENLTLADFDEKQISVGDIFRIGKMVVQATFPRIPCGKVNIRMERADAQQLMKDSGRSGVYFRIREPGEILRSDLVERIEISKNPYFIYDVYRHVVTNAAWTPVERERIKANGAFPQAFIDKIEI